MGDKEIPERGPVGRMGDPWDEERMKLALQRIITQMTVQPYRRIDDTPVPRPTFNNAQVWANWLVELLIARGVPTGWFGNQVGALWSTGTLELEWTNPPTYSIHVPLDDGFLKFLNDLAEAAVIAQRLPIADVSWE